MEASKSTAHRRDVCEQGEDSTESLWLKASDRWKETDDRLLVEYV